MTKRKSFKALVRERQQQTGESYTTARARLLAERSTTLVDELGLRCQLHVSDDVEDARGALAALSVLAAAAPEGALVRAISSGERPAASVPEASRLAFEARRFFAGVRGGARGFALGGLVAAVQAGAQCVVVFAWPGARPMLALSTLDEVAEQFHGPWAVLAGLGAVA